MPGRIPWAEKKFAFDFPADNHPEIIERLRGTPPRAEDRVKGIAKEVLTRRPGNAWSVQEHVGHLVDLDPLFEGRVEDFDARAEVLRPADLSNPHTEKARHNERELGSVLAAFRDAREKLVERVEGLAPEAFGRTALHPRLKVPMRLVDSLYFQAEHDDYHLARITELIREAG